MTFDVTRRGFLTAAAVAPWLEAAPAAKAPGMRVLGKTGLKISSVAFGCMVTSDASVIERAIDIGINHYDTARVYSRGNNERMVGAVVKAKRKNLIISTKSKAADKAGFLADLDISLKELGTDYVDIWYLHDKRAASDIKPELLEAQQEAKKQGKIRFAGLSLHAGHDEVIPATLKTGKIDVVLVTYNFAMGPQMTPLVKSIADAGVGVVAMKVMAGSINMDPSYDYAKAKETMKTPGAGLAALKWCLSHEFVHTTIPSIRDNEQLEENLRAMKEPYKPEDSKVLAAHLQKIAPLYCRMCGSCKGVCPKGLETSDMLRYLTYADGYGEFALAREHFLDMPEQAQQVRCEDCSKCAIRCPNGVRVQERLVRLQELMA